ncbi:MAG TPA: hypothetical protein VHX12_06130, partial [Acidisoma sp.]|nr:hypothetical protein [Acidisoma sp.]
MRAQYPTPRRLRRQKEVARGLAIFVVLAAVGIPTAAVATVAEVAPQPTAPPGPASPNQSTPQSLNRVPAEMPASGAPSSSGVITPPGDISRMPVIKPHV